MLEDIRHFRAVGGRHGDQDRFNVLGRDDGGQNSAVAEDPHPVNEVTDLRSVVVDEANDFVRQGGILLDLAEQGHSSVTGSVDERTFPGAHIRQVREFKRQPHCHADPSRHPQTEQEIQKVDGAREPLGAVHQMMRQAKPDAMKFAAARRTTSRMEAYRHHPRSNPSERKTMTLTGIQTQSPAGTYGQYCDGRLRSNRSRNASTPATANMASWTVHTAHRG